MAPLRWGFPLPENRHAPGHNGNMTENATPEPQYAHHVVPDPVPGADLTNVIPKLAAYHAARAQAFHLGTIQGHYSVNALISLTHEYHLARLYFSMDVAPSRYGVTAAVLEIADNIRNHPELIGPDIDAILTHYGVDPASIKAYRP